jgi:hypothetical protein
MFAYFLSSNFGDVFVFSFVDAGYVILVVNFSNGFNSILI